MSTSPPRERFFRHVLQGAGPLMVWALHFICAYGLVASVCCTDMAQAPWFGTPTWRVALWALSAVAAITIVALVVHSLRLPRGLLRSMGAGGGLLALLGVAWTTLPLVWALPLCSCPS